MNLINTIEDIAKFLKLKGERLTDASDFEIKQISDRLLRTFPDSYKQFLKEMGNGAGNFMLGSLVFINQEDWNSINDWSNELLIECKLVSLDKSDFPFWMHQGYQFASFKFQDGVEPSIYFFSESDNASGYVEIIYENLFDFLYTQLELSYDTT